MVRYKTKNEIKLPRKILARLKCLDCGINVGKSGDWYMAVPKIWEGQLGLGWNDNLCIACLEARLVRKVVAFQDIWPASSKLPGQTVVSERLAAVWEAVVKEAREAEAARRRRQRKRRAAKLVKVRS